MKINDNIADWFRVCIMAAVCCVALFGLNHCSNEDFKKRQQWAKDTPVEAAKNNCVSKVRGSRPACWSDGDWEVFCQKVECKQR